ncbi:hypothetical protein O1R50_08360 [Glycomyces luteolus]|uniref:Uncharacterized protein n=1 Tax=Glycomyces luteolus TaxID=2670330 RepID=A0A9X3P7E0_9ACTN|nr:hypothetical protein [Glycomyces luteolus]MDA1359632.1 hypothetical protein [Glycomyces luteolus]
MSAAAWLRESRLSKNLFVIAPGSTASEAEVAEAMNRHDGLSGGWAGPKPGWFQTVERVGRWWYLIAAALGSVFFIIFAPNGDSIWMKAFFGISAGPIILLLIQLLVYGIAWTQVKLTGGDKKAVLSEANKVARPAAFGRDRVGTILAMDPSAEPELHRLCWAASGVGEQGRGAAMDQIHEMWRRADPEAAAELDEMIRDTQEKLARFRNDGKA